jgi:hypothetical protein
MVLKTWCGRVMLCCRSEVVSEHHDGSLALMFRLPNGRFIVGYALGGSTPGNRGHFGTGTAV